MKKQVLRRGDFDKPIAAGTLFAGLVLIMSLISKVTFIFDGFLGFYLDLFQIIGYDLNLFGIIVGVIYAFVTGFVVIYLYNWVLEKIQSIGNK